MAETLVKNRICMSCGVEARSGALYCYNCGNLVSQNSDSENDTTSNVWFRGELIENEAGEKTGTKNLEEHKKSEAAESIISDEAEDSAEDKVKKEDLKIKEVTKDTKKERIKGKAEIPENNKSSKLKTKMNSRLRSASSLRRQAGTLSTKKVEVVWEERETAPNLLFIVVSAFLILFALVVFFLAMYLK